MRNELEKGKIGTSEILCSECNEFKKPKDFYKSFGNKSGVTFMCKKCLCNACTNKDNKMIDREKMIEALRKIDRPFIEALYVKNVNKSTNPQNVIGGYMKDTSLPQYKNATFSDSSFYTIEKQNNVEEKPTIINTKIALSSEERSRLLDKWGEFGDDELVKFERRYKAMSKSYQILSQMHEDSLIHVCRLEVFYTTALQEKNAADIKLFGEQLTKAKQEAKLNPNQLSKNDLTSTGANSFGEVSRLVASSREQIKLRMKYLRHPQDEIDFSIMCYINNLRESKGLRPASYEEIHQYYIDKIEKFNKRFNADVVNGDMGTPDER